MANEVRILKVELDNTQFEQKAADIEVSLLNLTEENKKLNQTLKKGEISQEDYAKQLVKNKREIKALKTDQNVYNKVVANSSKSLDGMRAQLAKVTREGNKLDVGSQQFKAAQKDIKQLTSDIKEFEEERGDFRRSVGDYGQALEGLGGQFGAVGDILKSGLGPAAIGVAVGAGIAAIGKLQARLEKTRGQVKLLTGEIGDTLDRTTAGVQSVADTFGQDFNEVLLSANSVAQAFNITTAESVELITKGFAAGANSTQELLDITREYPRLMKEAGLTADETFAIITQSVKSGIYSDKGIDAIKEGLLRIREMTPATKEALTSIGLSGSEIQKQLTDGTTTVFEVIQKVSGRLGELPAQSAKVGTAIADIFGGAGEDAGLEYLKTLKNIELNFDDVVASGGEVVNTTLRLAAANRDLELIFNQALGGADGLMKQLEASAKEFLVNGLQAILQGGVDVINFFRELRNESVLFRGLLNNLGLTFNNVLTILSTGFDLLINSFKSVGKIIGAVLKGDFASIGSIIKEGFGNAVDIAVDGGKEIGENFVDAYNETINPSKMLEPIKGFGDSQELKDVSFDAGVKSGEAFTDGFTTAIDIATRDREAALKRAVIESEEGSAERLEAEIALLQFEREQKLLEEGITNEEKLLVEAEFLLAKAELEQTFAEDQAEEKLELEENFQDAQETINKAKISSTEDVADAVIKAAGEESAAGKAALIIKKAAGIADVTLGLTKTIASNAEAGAKISALAPPVSVPVGVAYTAVTTGLAIAGAAARIATISGLSFDSGGIAFEGGAIPGNGGMITGKSHNEGGVKFNMGNMIGEADGRKGEAYIINTRNNPNLKKAASDLNVAGGGRSFFNYGGIVKYQNGGVAPLIRDEGRAVNQKQSSFREMRDFVKLLPVPIVLVDDISTGLSDQIGVEQDATV